MTRSGPRWGLDCARNGVQSSQVSWAQRSASGGGGGGHPALDTVSSARHGTRPFVWALTPPLILRQRLTMLWTSQAGHKIEILLPQPPRMLGDRDLGYAQPPARL